MKYFSGILFLSLLLCSCASRSPLIVTYPLLETTIRSQDGVFTGQVPRGWRAPGGDTIPEGSTVWLLREDIAAALAVKEINLDRASTQKIKEKGLRLLAELSLSFREDVNSGARKPSISEFDLNEKKCFGYELRGAEKEWKSVVVFALKSRYYECEAFANSSAPDDTKTVLSAQQAFVSSLR
jgi:hypothetical protein